jgi:hypothetical protein
VTGAVVDVAVPRDAAPRGPVRFLPSVVLTKTEAFAACQVLADADRCLVRAGQFGEADALCDLFELLEARMAAVDR